MLFSHVSCNRVRGLRGWRPLYRGQRGARGSLKTQGDGPERAVTQENLSGAGTAAGSKEQWAVPMRFISKLLVWLGWRRGVTSSSGNGNRLQELAQAGELGERGVAAVGSQTLGTSQRGILPAREAMPRTKGESGAEDPRAQHPVRNVRVGGKPLPPCFCFSFVGYS